MLRRLLLVAIAALALASPAAAFSKQDGTQTMDDGVPIALTRYTPDGAVPAGGWPGVLVLHGLGANRGQVDLIASAFANSGYSVLAYDARGHGASGGEITLAGPREVADLRALRQAYAARPEVHDTKIGAWGISYGGGQIWNALAAGVQFAAVELIETWTSLYQALWPQDLARSGIVAGLAAPITPRSPLVAGFRDDAVQSRNLHFFAATEYTAALTQPAGTTIGTVTAQGSAADLGGLLLPLTGTVQVRSASGTYLSGTTQVPLATTATQCTGTPNHTAFWVLILQLAGQTIELPVFVDQPAVAPPPGGSASAFASSSIQACLPPPDVPVGTPGRSANGFKLEKVDFTVRGVYSSSGTGQPRWRLLATPYTPGRGTPNQAGSVEAQSVVGFPRSVTLRKPAVKAVNRVVTLRIGGVANLPDGAPAALRLYRGARSASSSSIVLRKSGNAYSGTLRIKQTAKAQVVFLQTRASVAAGTVPCTPTFGLPCLSATRAAIAVRSNTVRIVIPKRK